MALAILDRQRGLTPQLAMRSPQVSGLLKSEASAVATAQALSNALFYTAHQFNVVRNMATLQMGILADELLELYWGWGFDEFLYVLREGVRQTWGKTYDRLDPPTVHGWCKEYLAVRESLVEHEASQRAQEHKKREVASPAAPAPTDPKLRALLAELDALDTQTLVDGLAHYTARWQRAAGQCCTCEVSGLPFYEAAPCLPADEQRKLAAAYHLVAQRRAAHYLAQAAKLFPAVREEDAQAKEADYRRAKMEWIMARREREETEMQQTGAVEMATEQVTDFQPLTPAGHLENESL